MLVLLYSSLAHLVLHSFPTRRSSDLHGPDRGAHQAAFEPAKELLLGLALVAHPAIEVDQRLHLVVVGRGHRDRKSTRLNSSHTVISYAVFCLKKKIHTLRQPMPAQNQ